MFPYDINNHHELFIRLYHIRTYEAMLNEWHEEKKASRLTDIDRDMAITHAEKRLIDMKRAARKFLREEREKHEDLPHLVKDDGMNGYVVLLPLPENITDAETADEWFRDWEYIEYRYTPYDCTGQLFTRWYKIINRNGRFYAYHSVGCDC